ncbi:MAG: type IV secretory system conjugative DNA transfer family protein [Acidimicrobiales bacterium]
MRPGRKQRPSGLPLGDLAVGAAVLAVVTIGVVAKVRTFFATQHAAVALPVAAGVVAALLGVAATIVIPQSRRAAAPVRARSSGAGPSAAGWATARQLRKLLLRAVSGDRVVLGRLGRRLVAAELLQSVLVVGPSQSGKTTGLAIPAVLDWTGPVLATSVKADLVRDTIDGRSSRGEVAVFDPTGVTGLTSVGWSPLAGASTWAGARRVAAGLCSVGRHDGGIEEANFWHAAAERLLAPLLRAASLMGCSMAEVVRWLDDETVNEPLLALETAREQEACRVARSCFALEDRQRSSVYATAQTIVAAYGDPEVAASEQRAGGLRAGWLFEGDHRTLYCCAPARDQSRLSPIFVALIAEVLESGFDRAVRSGHRLDPPLLVVLDEAANIAPLGELDQLLATAAGHGVLFVTVWQDLAQIEARYGTRWATIVNNHRAKVVCPGVADPRTLELLSSLIGDVEIYQQSRSRGHDGAWSETEAPSRAAVAPSGWIRRLPEQHCLVVYGGLAPVLIQMRPWNESRHRDRGRSSAAVVRTAARLWRFIAGP